MIYHNYYIACDAILKGIEMSKLPIYVDMCKSLWINVNGILFIDELTELNNVFD